MQKKLRAVNFNRPLSFTSGKFNGAIFLEVIEHLIDYELFLKEIYRILKPNGWLIISISNNAWWEYRLFILLGQPLCFFTHQTLVKYLNEVGFKIKDTRNFTTLPFINRWLSRPIYPTVKCWVNLLAQDPVFLCRKK